MRETWPLIRHEEMIGKSVGASSWQMVSQEIINRFADLTGDHTYLHTDPERAALESPYGTTIAHGFLTLSLLANMVIETIPDVTEARFSVNYGLDLVRFLSPVKSGASIRGRFMLNGITQRQSNQHLFQYDVTVDIQGEDRPALYAKWKILYEL